MSLTLLSLVASRAVTYNCHRAHGLITIPATDRILLIFIIKCNKIYLIIPMIRK